MWFRDSAARRLQAEIKGIEAGLADLRAEECLMTARAELESVRSGRATPSFRQSVAEMEYRKRELGGELRELQERRDVKLRWFGSGVWAIAGVYAMVWLSTIRHPEWAIATTVTIGSVLGFATFGAMMIWQFAVWLDGY